MKIYSEIIGNINTDANWAGKLKEAEIEYLDLDPFSTSNLPILSIIILYP